MCGRLPVGMCGRLPVGMCGRLPVGKRFCDVDASWSGAAMCPAFWCGVHVPLALTSGSLLACVDGSCVDGSLLACVDGSLLARDFVTLMQAGRVLPCVRPFGAAYMAAGPNAIRGVGSQSCVDGSLLACVDGSLLARDFVTLMQAGRVLPCVRPFGAAYMAAGPNVAWRGDPRGRVPVMVDGALLACVDGSLLARDFVTLMQAGRVLPCVRPFGAAYMAAGPNAIRGVGSQSCVDGSLLARDFVTLMPSPVGCCHVWTAFASWSGAAAYMAAGPNAIRGVGSPCVDGSLLARDFVTLMQAGRVLPCVRPFGAAYMAAGPNAIRGVGSQS